LAEVEVDEVLRLMGDVASEVSSHDAMPGGIILLVKLLLDVCSNILLYVELFYGLGGTINRILLHLLRHVDILYYGFAV